VAKGGELQAQNMCKSKPPLSSLQSCSYITYNQGVTRDDTLGIEPCLDPEEDSVNGKELVAETSAWSIN
jgi:hypothetical protein